MPSCFGWEKIRNICFRRLLEIGASVFEEIENSWKVRIHARQSLTFREFRRDRGARKVDYNGTFRMRNAEKFAFRESETLLPTPRVLMMQVS